MKSGVGAVGEFADGNVTSGSIKALDALLTVVGAKFSADDYIVASRKSFSAQQRLLNAPRGADILIRNIGDDVTNWLGKDARVITNEFGDTLVESCDGLRQIRFDFNHPYPHKNPHTHLIEFKWVKNKKVEISNRRIHPQGVTPE